MEEQISVVLADDHPPFRAGLRALLASALDIEVVGEAGSGADAILQADKLQPDVILMDLQMPEVTGIEATRRILYTSPHIAVLVLTMFEDDDTVFAALRAGACGYLLKGAMKADILRAVRAVSRGEAIFGAPIARRVLSYFAAPPPSTPDYAFPELTERERDVLGLLAAQQTNQEIARRLQVRLKTVQNHVSNIFSKLQVADRAQAMVRAREARLGEHQRERRSPADRQ